MTAAVLSILAIALVSGLAILVALLWHRCDTLADEVRALHHARRVTDAAERHMRERRHIWHPDGPRLVWSRRDPKFDGGDAA